MFILYMIIAIIFVTLILVIPIGVIASLVLNENVLEK